VDYTREPIIETVITPREGCKIVVRSSKVAGQEEYFVDAVEVVSFGHAHFFRSTERPKPFLVPVSDYEVLELREARIVLKNVGNERSIKIAGGREGQAREPKEKDHEAPQRETKEQREPPKEAAEPAAPTENGRKDRRRDRRRQNRRRGEPQESVNADDKIELEAPKTGDLSEGSVNEAVTVTNSLLTTLLTPPPLITETIGHYREHFREAFYDKKAEATPEEQDASLSTNAHVSQDLPAEPIILDQPSYASFEMTDEETEEVTLQRKRREQQPEMPSKEE